MNNIWIGTNWKMTKTTKEAIDYTEKLKSSAKRISEDINLFIIPSYTSLDPVKESISETNILLGSQNMHWADKGPYTGEISPRMLKEIGIDLIELGHSERRQYYNETDEMVNKKLLAALKYKMKPLVCIGENKEEKEYNISKEILSKQIKVCLKNVSNNQLHNLLIAYEPVWAIGEHGEIASSDYIAEIHLFIRKTLIDMYGDNGNDIPILFGGSVNQKNYLEYINIPNVNGLFIGRSAWDIDSFDVILDGLTEYLNRKREKNYLD